MELGFSKTPNSTRVVIGILLISLVLRWVLILRGGQYYFSDEQRYQVSQEAAASLLQGNVGTAVTQLMVSPEHLGFKVIGIIPALLEHVITPSLKIPALFFSFFSVLNLYLIFLLSRRMGASSNESLIALMIAASCLSLLYYARHLLPYDTALSFGLLALYVGLAEKQTAKTSLACGSLGFLCFITYNGYWSLAGFALLAHVLINNEVKTSLFQKAMITAFGFIAPLAIIFFIALTSGINLFIEYRRFASTITQGNYAEGWSLPFAYFWHTEHAIILILGALSIFALINSRASAGRHIKLWAAGILFIYLCLLIPSVFLHAFVVYGRLARQMIPFLILLSAAGFAQMDRRGTSGYKLTRIFMAAVLIQAAWNFISSYNLSYPRQFVAEAQAGFPEFEFSPKRFTFGAPVMCQNDGYIIENAKYFVMPPETIPQIPGRLLLSAAHPSNFLPYQYDGDPPDIRRIFQMQKLKMNFYKVDDVFMSQDNPAWTSIKSCVINEK